MLRQPAVAGYFYQGTAATLRRQIEEFIIPDAVRSRAYGILAPHAGLIYSGAVAGAVYSNIEIPDTVVLIGPNHTGLGTPVSLMRHGRWQTPLGAVDIDEALAAAILSKSNLIREDSLAHLREHSLEVQLPFLQYFREIFKIVPIQMLDIRLETCLALGRAVAAAIQERRALEKADQGRDADAIMRSVLIVASSDMTHYESAETAREKDFKAIQHILDLDPEGLYHTIKDNDISMCGFGPAVAMLSACRALGATRADLIKYANSGDASNDFARVVGYAGIVVR